MKHWFSILFSLLGTGGLIYYISRYSSELKRLREFSASSLVILLLLVILGHILSAMKFRLSASAFGVDLPFGDAFMMVESGSLVNVVPFSAMGFRALYLKKVYGLKYVHFGLGVLATLLTSFTSAGVLGLIGILTLAFESQSGAFRLLISLFLAYIIAPVLLIVATSWFETHRGTNLDVLKQKRWWSKIYNSLLDSLNMLLVQQHVLVQFLLLNLSINLILATRLWLVSQFLGYPFNFWSGLVLQSVSQLNAMVVVLPAGTIGLREAFIGLGAKGLNSQAVHGVMISAVDRLIGMICIVLLGGGSLLIIRHKIAQAERKSLTMKKQTD